VKSGGGRGIVATELLGQRYYVADDENRSENMAVLGLLEQLIDLQKSNKDRPATIPVQVLP
jgi:hypothetical protein